MSSRFITIEEQTPLGAMVQLVVRHSNMYFYVVDDQGELRGVVAVDDLRQVILDSATLEHLVIAADVMRDDIPHMHADDTLDKVMLLFGTAKRDELPVVVARKQNRMIGVVNRQALITAYNSEVLKRDAFSGVLGGISSAVENQSVILSGGIAIAEVEAPGWMVGKTLAQLNLRSTKGVQVLMINPTQEGTPSTESAQLVPRPDYIIQLNDNLLLLGPVDAINALKS